MHNKIEENIPSFEINYISYSNAEKLIKLRIQKQTLKMQKSKHSENIVFNRKKRVKEKTVNQERDGMTSPVRSKSQFKRYKIPQT